MPTQLSMFGAQYDGKQGDLLVPPARLLPPPASTPPVAPTAPEGPALCMECGDPLPPKAKVCPNCYTKRTEYNAEDMARAIWAETLAKSEGR